MLIGLLGLLTLGLANLGGLFQINPFDGIDFVAIFNSEQVQTGLGYLNWFIPIGDISGLVVTVLNALLVFFGIKWIGKFLGIF